MKRAYSYLELLIVLGVLAVLLAGVLRWQSGYVRQMRDTQDYYQERQAVLHRLEIGDYDRTSSQGNYRQNEIDWRGRKIIKFSLN